MANIQWAGPSEWNEWTEWLATGLHGRNRWRLSILMSGALFAVGLRTVSSWLRAAGITVDYEAYYYFLSSVGRNAHRVASQLLLLVLRQGPLPERVLLVIDDTPTKRYGPHVEGADIHHNPTPGPADQKYLYGHVWVTLALAVRRRLWGAMALPLQAMLYVRQRTLASIPPRRSWTFRTKLELAVQLVREATAAVQRAEKRVWLVVDGGVPISGSFWTNWMPNSNRMRRPICWWVLNVIDHFSRRSMGCAVFKCRPTSEEVTAALDRIMSAENVRPKHLIVDQGSEF